MSRFVMTAVVVVGICDAARVVVILVVVDIDDGAHVVKVSVAFLQGSASRVFFYLFIEVLGLRLDCICLIDESDIFLETRAGTDVLRNALVCVMLRLLEYR